MRQLLIVLMFLFALPSWAETRDVENHFFQSKLGDFQAELETAKKEGKKGVFLFFEQDDCPWCARMKATILNQSVVQDYFRKHFLIYAVDINGDVPMTDFQGKSTTEKAFSFENRVRATPVMIFVGTDGKIMTRYTGPTKDVNEIMMLGRYVVEDGYKQIFFVRYKQAVIGAAPAHNDSKPHSNEY